jgi:acyl-CoA thioester hydrolase
LPEGKSIKIDADILPSKKIIAMPEMTADYQLRVFYEDTDAGGLVYHANYLKFVERARTEWLRKLSIDQSFFLEQNTGFVVTRVEMDNIAAAKLDDLLTVSSKITELKRASMLFTQHITNEKNTLLCKVKVRVAHVNLLQAKPCAIPEIILGALKGVI